LIVFSAAVAVSLAQPVQVAPQPSPNAPQPAPNAPQPAYTALQVARIAPRLVQIAQNAVPAAMVPPADAGTPSVPVVSAPAVSTPAPVASAPAASTSAASNPTTATAATPADATSPSASNEIVVSGAHGMQKIDPVMQANKVTYAVMQKTDDVLVAPAMHVYRDVLPKPIRTGLHNFFFNLTEPVNALNYMLQLHPGNALRTVARFGINTTIGIGGLIDVAKKKPFNLHYRRNGFANTLGYYGIGPGPYFFLPLVGPTTLRDLVGTLLGQAALPTFLGGPFNTRYYVIGAGIVTQLDYRAIVDDDLAKVRKSKSPYSTYRQAYLKTRYDEIEALHGRGPLAKGEEGEAPFAKPLGGDPDVAALVAVPAPVATAPIAVVAPAPVAPPPMMFVDNPMVQALPATYTPHHHR
jgi:phospholipid-binding lipoprotein MlaA